MQKITLLIICTCSANLRFYKRPKISLTLNTEIENWCFDYLDVYMKSQSYKHISCF